MGYKDSGYFINEYMKPLLNEDKYSQRFQINQMVETKHMQQRK